MRALSARLGRPVGPSTGTNLVAALVCADNLQRQGLQGSVATILCDDGLRYQQTCFDAEWRRQQGLECDAELTAMECWMQQGQLPDALRTVCRVAGTLAG